MERGQLLEKAKLTAQYRSDLMPLIEDIVNKLPEEVNENIANLCLGGIKKAMNQPNPQEAFAKIDTSLSKLQSYGILQNSFLNFLGSKKEDLGEPWSLNSFIVLVIVLLLLAIPFAHFVKMSSVFPIWLLILGLVFFGWHAYRGFRYGELSVRGGFVVYRKSNPIFFWIIFLFFDVLAFVGTVGGLIKLLFPNF